MDLTVQEFNNSVYGKCAVADESDIGKTFYVYGSHSVPVRFWSIRDYDDTGKRLIIRIVKG